MHGYQTPRVASAPRGGPGSPERRRPSTATLLILLACAAPALAADEAQLLRSDSRTPYVHRITLYDHDGTAIDPTDEFAGPYSPRMTCGKCHDYATISAGWHFNAMLDNAPAGRPGEPWIIVDPATGTQSLISGRGWPGTRTLTDAGLTNWQFLAKFGAHTPGGGFGDPREEAIANSPHRARWNVSGHLDIDCMVCHSAGPQHDAAEIARQIERQNLKWAPSAALGLAVVRGDAKDAPDDWDPMMPANPNMPDQGGPEIIWDNARFDSDDRVFFDIVRRPPNERCYFCHSTRLVGEGAPPRWATIEDVHLAAGLKCVDCHRNGLDHIIVRGYDDEAAQRAEPLAAAYSCEGCHLGVEGAADPTLALGGHYGAPRPQHRGLPPLHFEKLTCTACHAGPWPGDATRRVQTALAHGLGLPSHDRTDDTPPLIVEPVFGRQPDGRIAPQRMTWAGDETYRWSIGHDVRPASQSLGVNGCTDCHATDAPLVFGSPLPTNLDPETAPAAPESMAALRGDSQPLAMAWGLGFLFRPIFKWFAFICAGLVAIALIQAALVNPAARRPDAATGTLERCAGLVSVLCLVAGLVINTITGFGPVWLRGSVGGWALFVHMFGAPLFIVGLTGVAVLWASGRRFGLPAPAITNNPGFIQKSLFWLAILLSFLTTLPMLAAMLPVVGYAGQETLIELHELSALGLLIVAVLWAILSLRARQAQR